MITIWPWDIVHNTPSDCPEIIYPNFVNCPDILTQYYVGEGGFFTVYYDQLYRIHAREDGLCSIYMWINNTGEPLKIGSGDWAINVMKDLDGTTIEEIIDEFEATIVEHLVL